MLGGKAAAVADPVVKEMSVHPEAVLNSKLVALLRRVRGRWSTGCAPVGTGSTGARAKRAMAALTIGAALVATTTGLLPAAESSAATRSAGWLHTSGSKILTSAGNEHTVKSVNWFGMETTNCAPHGLWAIGLDDGLATIASMGFNTIRLPYSNECIRGAAVSGVDTSLNPALAGKTPLQIVDVVVKRAEAHGLSIILDRHRPSSAAQSELWYSGTYSEKAWIADWVMLAKRYATSPTVIGADLHNEPHGAACWGCSDAKRDWAAAATRAGSAVLAANPKLLILVEGVERQRDGANTWWGAGLADAATRPIVLPVAHRVVYSPHEYPNSVSAQPWFDAADYPANLPGQWDKTWGYLVRKELAPVIVGEFGTKLETRSDQQWLDGFVNYLRTNRISFSYWSFNPNSGDTGGLVQADWTTPEAAKLSKLAPLLAPTAATPTASWRVEESWPGGHNALVSVSAGGRDRTGWQVSWADPNARSVATSWGMTCSVDAGVVTCQGADWGRHVPAGTSVSVGVQLNTVGPPAQNPQLRIT